MKEMEFLIFAGSESGALGFVGVVGWRREEEFGKVWD